MKTRTKRVGEAKVYACAVMIVCPHPACGEPVRDAEGRILWPVGVIPKSILCTTCGKVSRVAATIRPH